ncbi:MAG: transcriptional regulator [Clostridia bacterium]|nr:transcriptional regulator [Clostridia bacterium]
MPKKNCCKLEDKEGKIKLTAKFLDLISETNRLNILRILRQRAMSVGDIWEYLDLPQNLVSHHLKVLKDFGLLNSKRNGKKVIYSLDQEVIKRYKSLLIKFI